MLFLFPPKERKFLVDPNLDYFEFSEKPICHGDTFYYCGNNEGNIGEIILYNDNYEDVFREKYKKIYNVFRLFRGQDAEYNLRLLAKNPVYRSHVKEYFSLVEEEIVDIPLPENYDFLVKERELIYSISQLNVNYAGAKNVFTKRVNYNMYKGRTGRLVTEREGIPILNMSSEEKKFIFPNNSFFVEYDLSSADMRTFCYVFGGEREKKIASEMDLYKFFRGETREEKKRHAFALIYSKTMNEYLSSLGVLERVREYIVDETEENLVLHTPFFNRKLVVPKNQDNELLFISYIIQSVTNDVMLSSAYSVYEILKELKSKIVFLIHDAFVIDCAEEEFLFINSVVQRLATRNVLGKWFWKVRRGQNLGEMEDVGFIGG